MSARPFIRKRDVWLLAAVLAAAIAAYLLYSYPGQPVAYARISVNGQVVRTLDLTEDGEYVLETNPRVVFAVRGGAAAFTGSDCPDKTCVRGGWLKHSGQTAACLPNGVLLTVVGEGGVDFVAY